jgi:hypothetical protein
MSIPKHLQAMTEEEVLQDLENFRIAIEDRLPELKIARSEKNHRDARSRVCLREKQPTNAVYSVDFYTLDVSLNHAQMETIPPPEKVVFRQDQSGSRWNNFNVQDVSGPSPFEVQELRTAKYELEKLERELRYSPACSASDPRIKRRDELIEQIDGASFFAADGADRDRKAKKFLTKPKAHEAMVPLDINTPDSALHKATAEQIKDLLRRRKEEREKVT